MKSNHLFIILGLLGAILRISLWYVVPPQVMYDDHFEPTMLFIAMRHFPYPNLCFECFQPPFFYVLSAGVYKVLELYTSNPEHLRKGLQSITLLFSLGTILIAWKIIGHFRFSKSISLLVFAIVCFLPRHIFMSVTHSNDTALYFFVLATVLAALNWKNSPEKKWWLITVTVLGALAILTKSIAVVIFPFLLVFILTQFSQKSWGWRIGRFLLVAGIPFLCFSGHLWWKSQYIGNPFQMNLEIFKLDIPQRPGERDVVSFDVWEYWKMPMVRQENTTSLMPTLFMQFWFESEPKISWQWFQDETFGHNYQTYINYRNAPEQPDWSKVPLTYIVYGRIGLLIGLCIGAIFLFGVLSFFYDQIKERSFRSVGWSLLAMLAINLAGIISLTAKFPMYSFMKGAFLLTSLASLICFTGVGMRSTPLKMQKWLSIPVLALMLFSTSYTTHLIITYVMR